MNKIQKSINYKCVRAKTIYTQKMEEWSSNLNLEFKLSPILE